jgi:hypothetical protein
MATERDEVIARYPDVFTFEGTAYYAAGEAVEGVTGVYRFFHKTLGTHFYTASAAERDDVISQYPDYYDFEGTAFHVAMAPRDDFAAVHRFFHKQQGSHFYTASEAERGNVVATLGHIYDYEGVAYYVPTTNGLDPLAG